MRTVTIPYGTGNINVDIPEKNIIGVYSPHAVPPVPDMRAEIKRALANPIGCQPLNELVRGKKKVVLIADDNTRLTPTQEIVPILLDEMNQGGVRDEEITLIIALGTHRGMTDEEILAKFGPEVVRRITIKNHPFRDKAQLVDLGTTPLGTPISINKEVCEADFLLGIGSIVPHHIPGFSGGAKIIQPGVSGEDTTGATHLLSVNSRRSFLGILDNPVRQELNEIAAKVGLSVIFNTVLEQGGQLVQAFFGDTVAAFKAGAAKSQEVYGVNLPEPADIVLASSHPCDIEFWQAHKTLYAADNVVKEGGIIVVITPCPEGIAMTHSDMVAYAGENPDTIRSLLKKGQIRNTAAAALAIAWGQIRERADIYLVSEGIHPTDAVRLGFKPFFHLKAALDRALECKGEKARIAVLTHAPDMLPVVKPSG